MEIEDYKLFRELLVRKNNTTKIDVDKLIITLLYNEYNHLDTNDQKEVIIETSKNILKGIILELPVEMYNIIMFDNNAQNIEKTNIDMLRMILDIRYNGDLYSSTHHLMNILKNNIDIDNTIESFIMENK